MDDGLAREMYDRLNPLKFDSEDDHYQSYDNIVSSFGFKVVIEIHDQDYQGDSRYLFIDSGKQYGWLQFGWGSCSGCDTLQGCSSREEVYDLRWDLFNRIKWFESVDLALKFFKEHDWEGDYSWHSEEQKDFVLKCVEYLQELKNGLL